MRIEKGQLIAGYPVLQLRNFFKRYEEYDAGNAAHFFTISQKAAKTLCLELVALGYSRRIPVDEMPPAYQKEVWYDLEPLGRALRLARAVAPITRQKADKLFAEFMKRVHEVNTNKRFVYKVEKVLLFGSYIRPDVAMVGDIDIAINIIHKFDDPEVRLKKNDEYVRLAMKNGRQLSSWFERLTFAESDTRVFLKNKSRYLSLHSLDDGVLEQTETIQIYPKTNFLTDWLKRLLS